MESSMARTLRIDSITAQGGAVSVGITSSTAEMPPSASKNNLVFASRAEIVEALRALEAQLSHEQLLLLAIATAYKQDGTLSAATLQSLVGKTVALTLTAGAALVRVS